MNHQNHEIQKYTAWFHDGDLKEITHDLQKDAIEIVMTSAQIVGWENRFEKLGIPSSFD